MFFVLDTVIVTALCARSSYLPGPTIARLRRPVTGSKTAETPREGYKEAAFPATESTRTSRDLAPDASFAAQASGFFYVLRPAAGKRNFAARWTREYTRATCRDDAPLTIRIMRIFVTQQENGVAKDRLTDEYLRISSFHKRATVQQRKYS